MMQLNCELRRHTLKLLADFFQVLVESGLNLDTSTGIGEILHFFLFATTEIFIIMVALIFVIGLLRSFINPSKVKDILARVSPIMSHVLSSLLGAVTPFCSCSSVPVFIGFIESGIPLGSAFSFLITSPIVNEAAIALLWAAFGWKVALAYTGTGILIGILGGWIIQKLHLEHLVESYIHLKAAEFKNETYASLNERFAFAWKEVKSIVSHVWKYVFIGIAVGAFIHGWTPDGLLIKYAGPNNPLAVIFGVLIGVPVYTSNVMMIPIVETLIGKGMGVGTALAFMMAASALSLPEMIMLRKVLKAKLVSIFVLITSVSIVLVGYLFNFFLTGVI